MHKLIKIMLFTIAFILYPLNVFANGNIVTSPSSLTIEVGSSKTFSITATNTIGDVSIISSNNSVAKVSSNEWETGTVDENQTKSGTITIFGISEGDATITLTLDAATFDGEDLSGQKRTINVKIISKNNMDNNNNNNNNKDNKSNNNLIKKISVEGFDLVKVNNNNYTLEVPHNVTNINVDAIAEDSKATVSGIGNHELKIGENNIEIVVTSESKSLNKINIKVTRKDALYLDDLDNVLKDNSINNVDIIIDSNTKIDTQSLEQIKNSKKIVNLNYYNDDNKLMYDWILDGSKINETNEFVTTVLFETENKKEISKLSNYADGLYLKFKELNGFPVGTKLKLFVGNKFDNGELLKIYNYINGKLELLNDNLKVMNGYITFDLENVSDYFITMSTIGAIKNNDIVSNGKQFNIWLVIIPLLAILIIGGFIVLLKKNKKNNTDFKNNSINSNSVINNNLNVNNESYNSINLNQSNQYNNQVNNNLKY